MYWFSGDSHYNHSNIISKFVFRPFRDAAHMNTELIRRHNERVKPGHTVYHLGDFKVSTDGPNTHELIAMLNGNHVFMAGNHDRRNGLNTPLKFCVIQTYRKKVLLIHKPEDAQKLCGENPNMGIDIALVGHIHEKWKFQKGIFVDMVNVGVDVWDYFPIDAKQIFKAYKKWKHDGCPLAASGPPNEAHVV